MTSINSVSFCGNENKKEKVKNKGALAGFAASTLVSGVVSYPQKGALEFAKKTSKLSKKDSVELSKAMQKSLKDSGLAEKGVKIFNVQETNGLGGYFKTIFKKSQELVKKIENKDFKNILKDFYTVDKDFLEIDKKDKRAFEALKEEVASKGVVKHIEKRSKDVADGIKNLGAQSMMTIFQNGANACYLPGANKIILPSKSLRTSVFHEMGHALNANGNVILKCLQKSRNLTRGIPGLVLLISLLNKRPQGSEKVDTSTVKGKIQNVSDKIKNNAGLITALSMAPMVFEEGLASLRGQGIAKNLLKEGMLSKELLKKIKMGNLAGFTSYALALVGAVAATEVAIKVKDGIQKRHEDKIIQKMQIHQG